jgi:hypothetical protein
MKPRFSILTLLSITAYAALAIVSLTEPMSIPAQLSVYAYMGLLVFASLFAATEGVRTSRGIFSAAFVACSLAYGIVEAGSGQVVRYGSFDLPHSYIVPMFIRDDLSDVSEAMTSEILRIFLAMHCSVVFGAFGGVLALWRYRVMVRREDEEQTP